MQNFHRQSALLALGLGTAALIIPSTQQAATLFSNWSGAAHRPDARFDDTWRETRGAIRLDRGWLFARNDEERLYLLIDLTGDTVNDRPRQQAPWGDFVSLTFDLDLNGRITPDRDVKFAQYPGSYRLGRQLFKGAGHFSGLQPSGARLASNFAASPIQQRPHRIWEFSIPLKELESKPNGRLRLGLSTHSEKPAFSDSLPPRQNSDFKGLIELRLAAAPVAILHARLDPTALRRMFEKQRIVVRPKLERFRPGIMQPGQPTQPPNCPYPEGDPVSRTIQTDGSVVLTFANGAKKENFQGGWKIFCPDGREVPTMVLKSTQIPATLPPTLPDQGEQQWLEYHGWQLLGIIRALVDDASMVENYLATEADDEGIYQRIQTRSETISYLLAE